MPKRTRYPGVKRRGNVLHYQISGPNGERLAGPFGEGADALRVGQEKKAFEALKVIRKLAFAKADMAERIEEDGELPEEGVTIEVLGRWWNKRRLANKETKKAAKQDKWKLERYIYPALGNVLVDEYISVQGQDWVLKVLPNQKCRRGDLSPRAIRSIWSCFHNLFNVATFLKLVPTNPCILERGDLPKKRDKVKGWRAGATFDRHEVEMLISDERLLEWHRVLWALRFFTSVRPGEAAALQWLHWDTKTEVLGKLTVEQAWNTAEQELGDTKTEARRLTPVHPTLAKILAKWKLSGWAAHMGRPPKPDDLIIPSKVGSYLRVDRTLELFREDLVTLGLPRPNRDQYALRRAFKSLATGDGASPELLRWVMWGSKGDVADGYTSMPWVPVAREVAKLRVDLNEGKVLELRSAVGAFETVIETVDRFPPKSSTISRADTRTRTGDLLITNQIHGVSGSQSETANDNAGGRLSVAAHSGPTPDTANTVSMSQPGGDRVLSGLGEAATEWRTARDPKRLRKRLTALLLALEDEGGES